jgi:hypothetical protein
VLIVLIDDEFDIGEIWENASSAFDHYEADPDSRSLFVNHSTGPFRSVKLNKTYERQIYEEMSDLLIKEASAHWRSDYLPPWVKVMGCSVPPGVDLGPCGRLPEGYEPSPEEDSEEEESEKEDSEEEEGEDEEEAEEEDGDGQETEEEEADLFFYDPPNGFSSKERHGPRSATPNPHENKKFVIHHGRKHVDPEWVQKLTLTKDQRDQYEDMRRDYLDAFESDEERAANRREYELQFARERENEESRSKKGKASHSKRTGKRVWGLSKGQRTRRKKNAKLVADWQAQLHLHLPDDGSGDGAQSLSFKDFRKLKQKEKRMKKKAKLEDEWQAQRHLHVPDDGSGDGAQNLSFKEFRKMKQKEKKIRKKMKKPLQGSLTLTQLGELSTGNGNGTQHPSKGKLKRMDYRAKREAYLPKTIACGDRPVLL